MATPWIVKYLTVSALGGAVCGAAHGTATTVGPKQIAVQAVTGALLGPYAPVYLPLWTVGLIPNRRCPATFSRRT